MEMSERAVHINNLVALKDFCNNNGVFTLASNIEQSLDYAISSLKTDEAYQIMYEGGEIFTKDEVEKAIGKVEEYICDVETDTVKAQGMAQALDIFEQALRGERDGNVQLDSKRRMNNVMEYKGYTGSVEFSETDGLFYGKVQGIRSLISYEGTDAKSLVEDFHNAVDDYIELCEKE